MGGFLSNLRQAIDQASGQTAPWGDVNPLVLLGLTEAILDLGLTEEQLHASVRSYGRQLAAQVHPDRLANNVTAERQKQIIQAFDYIEGFDNFRLALKDFKSLKADERRESRILSQALGDTKRRLSALQAKEADLERARIDLRNQEVQLELQEEQRKKDASFMNDKVIRLEKKILDQSDQIRKLLLTDVPWKEKHERSLGAIIRFGTKNQSGTFAFGAKWVAVASAWPGQVQQAPPVNRFGSVHPGFSEALNELGIEDRGQEIMDEWKRVAGIYGKRHHYGKTWSELNFSLIKLEAGTPNVLFGNRLAGDGPRVIGCIPSEKWWVDSSRQIDKEKRAATEMYHLRSFLRSSGDADFTLATMTPFLSQGGLLVSIWVDPRRKVAWSLTCPSFRLITRRIILAVG